MKRWLAFLLFAMTFAPALAQDPKDTPPTAAPPEIMLARAVSKDGQVRASFTAPQIKPQSVTVEEVINGEKVGVTRMRMVFADWYQTELEVDGQSIKAFELDGSPLAVEELPKRLRKTQRVVVFTHDEKFPPKLDPYYLLAYKEGTVVFTIPAVKFFGPPRPIPVEDGK